jgi:hypothetical protein
MPVTIRPSPTRVGRNTDSTVKTSEDLLLKTSSSWAGKKSKSITIIQSSFSSLDEGVLEIIPYGNGLVDGIIRAFQQDLHLVLRPDDIWLSILTQFSMYVNANAETLRRVFVQGEGKKELVVATNASLDEVGLGQLSQQMASLIQENVVGEHLREWIMPNFTTTTDNDKSVAAIAMMGTLQKYFDYTFMIGCGFPSVTLLGEREDWEEILRRIKMLPLYGAQPALWRELLALVMERILQSFDKLESQEVKDFWLKACYKGGPDESGQFLHYAGWITAFCFWTEKGECLHHKFSAQGKPNQVSFGKPIPKRPAHQDFLTLDSIEYHVVFPNEIPVGIVSVPIKLHDLGTLKGPDATMVAGSIGVSISKVGPRKREMAVQPASGWWLLE